MNSEPHGDGIAYADDGSLIRGRFDRGEYIG